MSTFSQRARGTLSSWLTSFNERFLISADDTGPVSFYDFTSPEARKARYTMLWAYFQSNAYREIQTWVTQMKTTYGLYTYIRDIYNPVARIVNFHRIYTFGGPLDPEAGDGEIVPSALPIKTKNDALRQTISQLWLDSRWDAQRLLVPFYGSLFGDAFLAVNVSENGVVISPKDPRRFVDVEFDAFGNIIYYRYVKRVVAANGVVQNYEEVAELHNNAVHYSTYIDGTAADTGIGREAWVSDFSFIPVVHIKHYDVGQPFGWSETFPKLSTLRELDDIASKTSDQIRKMVDPVWMFSGVKKPRRSVGTDKSATNSLELADGTRDVGRRELSIIYATNPQAKANSLTTSLDLEATLRHIEMLQTEMKNHFPELRVSAGIEKTSGDLSGRALIISRQEATDKVKAERAGYDQGLVLAQQMACLVGAAADLDGYQSYKGKDFGSSELDHTIADRAVFRVSEAEQLEHEKQFWINAALAQRTGISLPLFLKYQGWSQHRIDEVVADPEYQLRLQLMQMSTSDPQLGSFNTTNNPVSDQALQLPDAAQTDPNKPMEDFATAHE